MSVAVVNQSQKNADMKFGNISEENILEYLRSNISNKIYKYRNQYSIMDYYQKDENNNIIAEYELKSRRIKHNQYGSLIFGENKFKNSVKQIDKNIRQIYIFNCLDGLYKWELKNPTLQKEEYYFTMCGNYARNDKPHSVCNIKTKYLSSI